MMTTRSNANEICLPILSDDPGGRRDWPVTQGIPLPDGWLARGERVTVTTPEGDPIPTQSECLATWGPNRAFVKWLLVDFPVSRRHGRQPVYRLRRAAASPQPADPVEVDDGRDQVSVSNGLITIQLRRTQADFFQRLTTRDAATGTVRDHLHPARHPHLVVSLLDRRQPDAPPLECRSDTGPFAPLIEVETPGPLRATVAVRGYHYSPDGLRVCPYTLRYHIMAGRPDLRLEHTLIFDQSPDRFTIAGYGYRFPLTTDASESTGWVGDEQGACPIADTLPFGMVQTRDDRYRIVAAGRRVREGGRSPGWIAHGGIGAALRECWRDYPVGLQFDTGLAGPDGPSATGRTLCLDFWPADAGPLDLASPFAQTSHWIRDAVPLPDDAMRQRLDESAGAPLDFHFARLGSGPAALDRCDRLRDQMRRLAPERPYAFSNTDIGNACGTAKTHEAWLRFSADPLDPDTMTDWARCLQTPVLALPDPQAVCDSGAARLLHPVDPAAFPDIEAALSEMFEKLVVEPESSCKRYGKFEYGDLINGHNVNDPIVYRAFRRNPEAWDNILLHLGSFNNESQDVVRQLWCFYLRTGDPDIFRLTAAKSRHTLDIDFVHRLPRDAQSGDSPNHPRQAEGQMHYHSATHWSGPTVTSHSLVSGIVTHYYLTGERRAREVTLAMADNLLRNQTPNGLLHEHGLHRELTGGLSILLEAWQLTWHEAYRALALNTLRMLRAVSNSTGNLPHKIFTGRGPDQTAVEIEGRDNRTGYPGGMLWYVLYDAVRLLDEPWIRDWIVQLAESWVHGIPCDDVLPARRAATTDAGGQGLAVHEIADGWYWHSWLCYANFFFDPLIVLAWQWTRKPRFLGYLAHRARIFPAMAHDAACCLTGHAFNAINHAGEAVPSILRALHDAGEAVCDSALAEWMAERERDGFPVWTGPYTGYDATGSPTGRRLTVTLRTGGNDATDSTSGGNSGRIRIGTWDPRDQSFISD